MTTLVVTGGATVSGSTPVPGDKSISHRALMLAAIARGRSTVTGIGPGEDVASTIACLKTLGVAIERGAESVTIDGHPWKSPAHDLDCGNSGSTMRMLAGLAAHHNFDVTLDGDASLRRRPMDRIVGPLTAFGAKVEATNDRFPPVLVRGGRLHAATVDTVVPSAQVKSCALFAAMGADGRSTVTEPRLSRDHTERMLTALRAPITRDGLSVEIGRFTPDPFDLVVPGDVSSAAFVCAAAVLCGDATIDGVGLNPTRTGFLDTIAKLGAEIRSAQTEDRLGEPVGTITAARTQLSGADVDGGDPTIQDELALIAVLATQADGETTVRGAEELRIKESDRISAIVEGLRALGAEIHELTDGFVIRGPVKLRGAHVDPRGDHRIAMALAVAGLVAEGETSIADWDCAAVSWPGFDRVLSRLGAQVRVA